MLSSPTHRLASSSSSSSTSTSMSSLSSSSLLSARIVVIGAGAAGIAAATRLLEAGFKNVLIVEAENRIGGRINTVPFGDNVIDLGAQWCHGEKGNAVFEMVQNRNRSNLLESSGTIYDAFECIRSNGERLTGSVNDLLKLLAFSSIPEGPQAADLQAYEGSLGSYLTEKFWGGLERSITSTNHRIDPKVAREFLDAFMKFESSIEGADHLFEVSGKGHLEYWPCEGDMLLNWRHKGYKTFLRLLMKSKINDDDGDGDDDASDDDNDFGMLNGRILLNRRIENIQWKRKGEGVGGGGGGGEGEGRGRGRGRGAEILIKCFNGELIEAEHVICTVSLGVLKQNHARMFTPALPENKCRAIDGLKLGTVDKLFLEFEKPCPLPDTETGGIMLLWLDEDLNELRKSKYFWLESVFGFYRVSHQPRLLEGWIIGAHARYMETLTQVEVLDGLMWLLRKYLDFPIPNPINFQRTQWYANPNFRGSYSFRSMYTDAMRTGAWDLAEPLTSGESGKPVVQFAGESTHRHYYSTVHGAVESGWREAQRLVGYYDGRVSKM